MHDREVNCGVQTCLPAMQQYVSWPQMAEGAVGDDYLATMRLASVVEDGY
jgi:hypothetical protein